ncbi:MAG: acyl-CoA dehydrogenase [Acidimicrobiales bacterium]
MSIGITTEHGLLAETVRGWAAANVGTSGRRAGIDHHPDSREACWAQMVELGWPVIHAPAESGGQGFGLSELAIVLEETGRAGVPGPLLPTALAVAVLRESSTPFAQDWLRRIAAGATAAVALASPTAEDGAGTWPNVLGAETAELVLAPVDRGTATWCGFVAADLEIADPSGVDEVRPVATVTAADTSVGVDLGLEGSRVMDLATILLCAEAVGVAAWCVDTAAEYAKQRVQFGRPIGQFQGVKHRCADMLASLELARAVTWDACRGGSPEEVRLAVACVGSVVPDAVVGVAKDCIQVLGGIGFTWEHDAHLYLRRALATRALLSAGAGSVEVCQLVRAGVRRTLPVELPADAEAIRPEVRAWIAGLTSTAKDEWNHRIADAGYLVPHWPEPWGRGASAVEQVVIDQEFAAAGVRRPHLQVAAWALPTLIAHGTPAQQDRWVRPSLRQEIMWCQLFSEPEAGSDLASLRMRAIRDGDGWRLTGQKVWTSMAHTADWGICLARTSPDKPPHEGITCFFVDMTSPGIEVRPLREINGDAWFNEVFFDDVFVPDECVISAVDDGWRQCAPPSPTNGLHGIRHHVDRRGVAALVGLLDDDSSSLDQVRVGALLARDRRRSRRCGAA